MLVRRLVVDTARRLWQLYAIAAGVLFFFTWISNRFAGDRDLWVTSQHMSAWSMTAAWFLASSPALLLEAREIAGLPLTRREIWLARWWMAAVLPAAAVVIALGAGALAGHAAEFEPLGLALLYCGLYGGCYMAVSAVFPLTAVPANPAWAVARVLFRMVVIPLGGALLPLWFASYLPRTFSDLGGTALGTLVAAAGVTIGSYFYQPPIVARLSRHRAGVSNHTARSRASMLDGLTGLTLLLAKEARKALVMYALLLAMSLAFWSAFGSALLVDSFRGGIGFIFSGLPDQSPIGFPTIAILLMTGISDVGLLGDMRSLRTLPLSVTALSAVLTGTTVMTTAILWTLLLAAHVMLLHALPASLRPDLFLVVLGGLAAAQALRLIWPAAGAGRAAAGAVTMLPMLVAFRLGFTPSADWVRAAMMFGGGAALVVSWLLNVRTLSRGTRIYKAKPTPLQAISS